MRRGELAALLAIVATAGGLRFVVMDRTFPVELVGDEIYYSNTAAKIADGRGHVFRKSSRVWRPPAFAWVLSHFVDSEGLAEAEALDEDARAIVSLRVLRTLLSVEVALGTALVLATALLGMALFDARVGLLAAAIAGVYPAFVAYSHYLWSEMLFATLLTSALALAVWAGRRDRMALAAAAGLVFGAATLTRELALGLAGVVALWWLLAAPSAARRRALARGALLLACAAAVVAPWTLRNHRVTGRWIPVSQVGWYAAAEGNTLERPDWLRPDGPRQARFRMRWNSIPGEMERADFARRAAREEISAEGMAWLPKKLVRNVALLYGPDSTVFYKLERDAYGAVGPSWERGIRAATTGAYLLVLVAGVVGVAAVRGGGRRLLPCLVFGAVTAVHVVANAATRFRIPVLPLLMVYASWAALHRDAVARQLRGPGWIAPAGVLLVVLGLGIPYILVFGGRL